MIPTILAGTERHSSDHRKQGSGARASSNPFLRERCSLLPCAPTRLHGPFLRSPTWSARLLLRGERALRAWAEGP